MLFQRFQPRLLLLLLTLTLLVNLSVQEAEDYVCGRSRDEVLKCRGKFEGQCCSKGGYCGTSEDHCAYENCRTDAGRCDKAKSPIPDGTWSIFKSVYTGHCLQHGPGSRGIDAKACDGSDSQQWVYNNKKKSLKNKETGKCLQKGRLTHSAFNVFSADVVKCNFNEPQITLEGARIKSAAGEELCLVDYPHASRSLVPYFSGCRNTIKIDRWTQ